MGRGRGLEDVRDLASDEFVALEQGVAQGRDEVPRRRQQGPDGVPLAAEQLVDEPAPLGVAEHTADEAGRAVVAWLVAPHRRLKVLTIVRRAGSLGLLAHGDRDDVYTRSRTELLGLVRIAFGGQVAEELFVGDVSTGPSGDLRYATEVAVQMVGSAGMAVSPSTESAQGWISAILDGSYGAGEHEQVIDADGNVVVEFESTKTFQSVVLSAAGLEDGASYTVTVGGDVAATVTEGTAAAGGMGGAPQGGAPGQR